MKSKSSARSLAFLLLAILVPACHDDGGDNGGGPAPDGGNTFKSAKMSGRQEAPPVISSGTGDATLVIDSSRTSIQVTVNFTGLTNLTDAHIHVGDIGTDGPIIFPLATGSFTSPLVVTLTESSFTPQPGAGITTFSQAVTAIEQGATYVNLHTGAFPDGEIRGQVGPVTLEAALDGLQEAPPVVTAASGGMAVFLNNDQSSMTFTLTFSGLSNITAAHIHVAPEGVDGPIIFPMADGSFSSPLNGTLTQANLTPQPAAGVNAFADAIDALISGLTYANVHTTANPDGEIRGQLLGEPVTIPPPPTKTGR